jgi:DNA-directed RNA polymerase I subunit RPA49
MLTLYRTNDMPRWNTDNLITHICAAALIVDGFEVDVNDIRNDLKLENKEYESTPPVYPCIY